MVEARLSCRGRQGRCGSHSPFFAHVEQQVLSPYLSSHMAILTVRSGDIQRQEKVQEVELLKHQKWSGAELVDRMVNVQYPEAGASVRFSGLKPCKTLDRMVNITHPESGAIMRFPGPKPG